MTQQQVYYRKWRPQRFGDVAGQDHITHTLRQAVAQGRIAHAYLFCGPRGTGKTSTARIMAKAINCLHPHEGDPDDTCRHCQAISEGRFLDLIELDAASNRGIDEARNIREKARLAPSEGKYKVYLLDEAHMLTSAASNALLKTLEEPPPHVVFILCTTDPDDLPITIVSRCQRYDFRRLGSDTVVGRLAQISEAEGIQADADTLRALARAAGGSLRDAANLLEQLSVSYGGKLTETQVRELLGLVGTEHALTLVKHLAFADAAAALGLVSRLARDGADIRQLHRQALDLLRSLMLLQVGATEGLDLPVEAKQELSTLASKIPALRLVRTLKLLGEVDLRHDAPSPLALELAIVESCLDLAASAGTQHVAPLPAATPPAVRPPAAVTTSQPPTARATAADVPRPGTRPAPPTNQPPAAGVQRPPVQGTPAQRPAATVAPRPAATPRPADGAFGPPGLEHAGPDARLEAGWENFVKQLSRVSPSKRFNLGGLLRSVRDRRLDAGTLVLSFSHKSHAERWEGEMGDPVCRRVVSQGLEKLLGAPHEVRVLGLQEGSGTPQAGSTPQSPLVRAALGMGARIVEEVEGDGNE